MSKLKEIFNVVFNKPEKRFGNTTFKLQSGNYVDIVVEEDGRLELHGINFSEINSINIHANVLNPLEGDFYNDKLSSASSLMNIKYGVLRERDIQINDTYSNNVMKRDYLSEKKQGTSRGVLKTAGYVVSGILIAFLALSFAFKNEGSTTDTLSLTGEVKAPITVTAGNVPNSSAGRGVSEFSGTKSREQLLRERNDQLIQPNAELAALLNKGVMAGDYSVSMGNVESNKGTLYVFSDPLCPHCQEIEPLLENLSSDYMINIFPVSVVGNSDNIAASSRLVKTALCTKSESESESRSATWKRIMRDPSTDTTDCEAGQVALKNNIDTFKIYKFIGTPALVRADGASFDLTKEKNPETIKEWISESAK